MTLQPDFPCLSPDSADPDSIPLRLQVEELAHELHQRREYYPKRVAKGRMRPEEAEFQIDCMAAIHADLEALNLYGHEDDAANVERRDRADAMILGFSWQQMVACLRREIGMRRKYYPDWIRGGALDPIVARHRLERIEAVHFSYWYHMRHYMPAELEHLRGRGLTGPDRSIFMTAARAHRARFTPEARRGEYTQTPSTPPIEAEPVLAFA